MHPIFIITGKIATGKSYLSKIFVRNKIQFFDTDKIAYQLLNDIKIKQQIQSILNIKLIDKSILKQLIKDNPDNLTKIENIIHKPLQDYRIHWLQNIKGLAVIEIPLFFEKMDIRLLNFKPIIIITKINHRLQNIRLKNRLYYDKELTKILQSKQLDSIDNNIGLQIINIDTNNKFYVLKQINFLIKNAYKINSIRYRNNRVKLQRR